LSPSTSVTGEIGGVAMRLILPWTSQFMLRREQARYKSYDRIATRGYPEIFWLLAGSFFRESGGE